MMQNLLNTTAASLRKAALNQEAKNYILNINVLFQVLKRAADRYIGGETLEETLSKVHLQNGLGYRCGIEFMGENTSTTEEATRATNEFLLACSAINTDGLNAALSLDLSHIGLTLSSEFCLENLSLICSAAASNNIEVTISAEGTEKTDRVLNTYLAASKVFGNLSITIQVYLHRSKDDLQEVMKCPGRIRLVKGAFDTPPGLSLARGEELNERYLDFLSQLLLKKNKCAIATHDPYIQQQAKKIITSCHAEKGQYEFESLYGIQPGQLKQLKDEGHPTKVYFVYGKEWYLYLCNRIAENPLSLFTAVNDIIDPGNNSLV
ncbi:proline dehydrogenase [Mucilaginibacter gynuensis]|uniref:proline dehydrogenase n=1 Tax=Mucilaginibacter gynuensis TaxID=1302236 RepID=A0ABP8GL05_9SPHI